MNRSIVVASAVVLALGPRGPQEPSPGSGDWVGTITVDGQVTTVVNESGSVWRGTAVLVEEASIGVELGANEYMLGQVSTLAADSERIYVANPTVPVVRMYTHDGDFLADLGAEGQGPGEYRVPVLVAVGEGNRIFVYDDGGRRINVYGRDGTSLDTWTVPHSGCCGIPMRVGADQRLWMPIVQWAYEREGGGGVRRGVQVHGPNGPEGEPLWVPENLSDPRIIVDSPNGRVEVPFSPRVVWQVAGAGSVAIGASDSYRFEVRRHDGSVLRIERVWEPTPVSQEHAALARRQTIAAMRERTDPGWNWSGAEIPKNKPAFREFIAAGSGAVWVQRDGASRRQENCVADPCWTSDRIIDAFAPDGRYLGEVEVPAVFPENRWHLKLFVKERLVLAAVEDEAGTIMVKRYRLVLPGEEER